MRLTTSMKSSLCESVRWAIPEGTLRGHFYLKVANEPKHRELIQALRRLKEPAATYFSGRGGILAWQWCLSQEAHRNIWNGPGKRLRA